MSGDEQSAGKCIGVGQGGGKMYVYALSRYNEWGPWHEFQVGKHHEAEGCPMTWARLGAAFGLAEMNTAWSGYVVEDLVYWLPLPGYAHHEGNESPILAWRDRDDAVYIVSPIPLPYLGKPANAEDDEPIADPQAHPSAPKRTRRKRAP